MTPNRLLYHFDRISEAPDAIPRLRRFILDLAVRGKLVEQDANDEPAPELLKRIQAEKAQLVKDGKVGKHNLIKDDAEAEPPFVVPETWEWTPATYPTFLISDLGKKIQTKDVLQAGKFPVVDQGKMFIRGYCNDSDKAIYVEEPVIIFGDHTRETKLVDFDFVVGADGVKILKPIQIVPAYYFLTLQWLPLDSRGYGRHFKLLRAMKIPLPPLAEQHRIVVKVDELMALCDRLEAAQAERESRRDRLAAASLHRLNNGANADEFREHVGFHLRHLPRLTTRPEHIQQLRQTILNLAVRGKLVPQDLNDEPVPALLQRLDAERGVTAKRDRRAEPDLQELLADELCWDVPSTWSWRGLADLALFIDYRGKTPAKTDSGIRLITAKNVRQSFVNLQPEEFVTEATYEAWMTRGLPTEGDILFTTEAPMGNAAVVRLHERFALAQRVINLRPYGSLNSDFLVLQVLSPSFQAILAETATGLTAKGIKAAKLKRLPVAVPPLAEQHRIVAKVEGLLALCDRLEAQITTTKTESRRLLEAVLHEALSPNLQVAK